MAAKWVFSVCILAINFAVQFLFIIALPVSFLHHNNHQSHRQIQETVQNTKKKTIRKKDENLIQIYGCNSLIKN